MTTQPKMENPDDKVDTDAVTDAATEAATPGAATATAAAGAATATATTTSAAAGTATDPRVDPRADPRPALRADLLALTEDYLATLANRGLVKRAAKELAAGNGAHVGAAEDGALVAAYPDGTTTRLAAGSPLTEATCSCAATGLCRHRIGLVLAYRHQHAADSPAAGTPAEPDRAAAAPWSPGEISDEALERVFGARPIQEARRIRTAGYRASVHRPDTSGTRNPRAELPTCTVTFHVAGDPAYATTDAVELRRGEAVALAVWAFRTADEQRPHAASVQVNVGGGSVGRSTGDGGKSVGGASADLPPVSAEGAGDGSSEVSPSGSTTSSSSSRAGANRTVLAHAAELVGGLLLDGVSSTGPLAVGNLRRAARDLAGASLLWPAAVVDALVEQLDWYLQRNARYELAVLADLATELLARCRAAAAPATDPALPSPGQILGTGESARTALRRIRLVGLGCRILGGPRHRTAELYFVHPADGTVLVLRREWRFDAADAGSGTAEQLPTGAQLRTRRVAGSPLHMLAACNLISEAASRSASRTVELGASRLAKTTVTAVGAAWSKLPEGVRVDDYAALAGRLGDRHPRYLRPRVEAEDIYVLMVDHVAWVGYDPASQCLEAEVHDTHGAAARVRAPFRSSSPAALDVLGAALAADGAADAAADVAADKAAERSPLMISGRVSVHGGGLVVDPIAVWGGGDEPPVVPDLAVGDDAGSLAAHPRTAADDDSDGAGAGAAGSGRGGVRLEPDALSLPLRTAADLLAEHAHRGLDRLGSPGIAAVEKVAAALSRTGFKAVAALFAGYGEALAAEADPAARVRAWTDASIALVACLEGGAR